MIITNKITANKWEIDELGTLEEMKEQCPRFFETAHGDNETFSVYRGQLIVANTQKFTGCKPIRKMVVYLNFRNEDVNCPLMCASSRFDLKTKHEAMELIDEIFESKEF